MVSSLRLLSQNQSWQTSEALVQFSKKVANHHVRGVPLRLLLLVLLSTLLAGFGGAQVPAASPRSQSQPLAGSPRVLVEANLGQLMRGILFPNSNVLFFAQNENPDSVAAAKDPSLATDPLASAYGKWIAVENSALAIVESANLLTLPGRKCANGRPVPIQNADWPKFVQGLRDAGMAAYKAAQSKNQDKMLDAAGTLSEACSNCHDKYREKANLADRCK